MWRASPVAPVFGPFAAWATSAERKSRASAQNLRQRFQPPQPSSNQWLALARSAQCTQR
jgi:hypothetical protein